MPTTTTASSRSARPRHVPKSRRPRCVAVRANLDPWYYPTLESFLAAVAKGEVRSEFAAANAEEIAAARADAEEWK